MIQSRENTHKALKRMLANGPLTAVPKSPKDQALLLQLAASRFKPNKEYREREVNDELSRWLETFSAPFGIDHVTMRRLMVDARLLSRDKAGSTYRVNPEKLEKVDVEPAKILAEIKVEREARKKGRAS